MKTHLHTRFVTLEGAYLRKDGAAIEIRHEGQTKLRFQAQTPPLNWKIETTDFTDYTDFMRGTNCPLIHFSHESKILLIRNLLIR